jgi:hypothetical protein
MNFPRLNGLFLAAIISATLSTMSSGLNALTTVILLEYQKQRDGKVFELTLSVRDRQNWIGSFWNYRIGSIFRHDPIQYSCNFGIS